MREEKICYIERKKCRVPWLRLIVTLLEKPLDLRVYHLRRRFGRREITKGAYRGANLIDETPATMAHKDMQTKFHALHER